MSTQDSAPDVPLAELECVRSRRAIRQGDESVSAGTLGTVVHVYDDGRAYEVEFVGPPNVVLLARGDDLERA